MIHIVIIMIHILVGSIVNSGLFPASAMLQALSPLSQTTSANEFIKTQQDTNAQSSVTQLEIGESIPFIFK
jgi:hypothetical protein